jgi:hypothetical protein
MSLHPILALDHVIDEARNYLRTELRNQGGAIVGSGKRGLGARYWLPQYAPKAQP